jgi:hypothetical protein
MADQPHLIERHRRHTRHPDQRHGDDPAATPHISRVAFLKFFPQLLRFIAEPFTKSHRRHYITAECSKWPSSKAAGSEDPDA